MAGKLLPLASCELCIQGRLLLLIFWSFSSYYSPSIFVNIHYYSLKCIITSECIWMIELMVLKQLKWNWMGWNKTTQHPTKMTKCFEDPLLPSFIQVL